MQPGDFQRLIDAKVIDFKMGEKGCKEERVYRAIVAGTPLSQELGFGQRTTPLSADESMFFVYDVPKFTQFWMKNTPSDLDIIFAFNKKIVGIVRGAAFSEDHVGPDCLTDLVVEVPAGFVKNKNTKIGDSIDLVYGIKSLARLLSYEKEVYG
jgi:uncharacterized membrane protein (UPF0127 family)